ncbi:mannitol-1-phosphate 5-dehydrogenase [Halobacillus litoralis]|uniref:Mannitol-1-phosphate 5-dehydrogenase n=1 Tax=Halobacillus litoralis TaxID=45668 RepID=A0A845DMC7_9BACI|nr:mannitol-1-phosphate 5-dehydrogenase [Halobacillus litoralis]MYL18576.1 mannitol-1-phosphate 5-dehydrogenase [Halobacillus litoralis]
MKAVHFGAGNIGRGFIGALLDQSGFETIFVDVNETLIDQLNERRSYTVDLAGSSESLEVNHVSGLNSIKQKEAVIEAIAEADLVTTAVGPHILSVISGLLAEGLKQRAGNNGGPVNVIACENMIGGSESLKASVLEHLQGDEADAVLEETGFPNAAVDRIVPDQSNEDPLAVKVEPYYEWVVETPAIKGERPAVEGITYVNDLTPYIERKLFTVNTGHAVPAYLGYYYGHKTIMEAMNDPKVKDVLRGTLAETGAVLIEKYGFDKETHQAYADKIIGRFENPDLSDEVTRVGRAPKRKLGPKDRLIRPAVEYAQRMNEEPAHLAEVIAAALLYDYKEDPEAAELQEELKNEGLPATLARTSGLDAGHPLVQLVEQKYNQMKA